MSGHGGARPGAGRPKGAVTVRSREVVAEALKGGPTPLEVMLENMRFHHQEAQALITKLLSNTHAGSVPEDFDALGALLQQRAAAQKCAEAAAPYIHPRLSAVALVDEAPEAADGLTIEHDPHRDHLETLVKRFGGGLKLIEGSKGK